MDSADDTLQSLRAENERLRRRVEELERSAINRDPLPGREPGATPETEEAPVDRDRIFKAIVEDAPLALYIKDQTGRYLLMNRAIERVMGWKQEHVLGKTDYELLSKEDADAYTAADRQVLETEQPLTREDTLTLQGKSTHWVTIKFPLYNRAPRPFAVCSATFEITPLTRAREENKRLQDELIRFQEESLRALSTPLLPIAPGVVIMPLIGTIDRGRADLVLDTLLRGINEHRASVVILDITGVPVVDAAVANTLVQAAHAVKLLGAEAVLTGVRPKIARTLVDLGAELSGIVVKSTLQSGVAYALDRSR